MKKNGKNPAPTERYIKLSEVEQELVKSAVAENQVAKQAADNALAQRLAPIRRQYKLAEGTRADFRPTKDQKSLVMVVFEESK
jgi:hypothetical protein